MSQINLLFSLILAGAIGLGLVSPVQAELGPVAEDVLIEELEEQLSDDSAGMDVFRTLASFFSNLTDFRMGVGVSIGGTIAGVSGVYGVEAVHLSKNTSGTPSLALYCAPGIGAAASFASASVGVTGIKTYNCNYNSDYTGNFYTLSWDFAVISVAHSWGANSDHILSQLEEKKELNEFRTERFWSEIGAAIKHFSQGVGVAGYDENKTFAACLAAQIVQIANPGAAEESLPEVCKDMSNFEEIRRIAEEVKGKALESGEDVLKEIALPELGIEETLAEIVTDEQIRQLFPNLLAVAESMVGAFSGCNSWSVSLGPRSWGAAVPFTPSANVTHYSLMAELDQEQMSVLKIYAEEGLSGLGEGGLTVLKKTISVISQVAMACPESMYWTFKDLYRFRRALMFELPWEKGDAGGDTKDLEERLDDF